MPFSQTGWSMTSNQRRLDLNSYVTSHFSQWPIVWMFHSKGLDERICNTQERTLRAVYKNYKSPFSEFLRIYLKRITLLPFIIEIWKKFVNEIFKVKKWPFTWTQKWCFQVCWKTPKMIGTTKYGAETPLTLALNYGIFFQMNVKLLQHLKILRQKWDQKFG